MLFTESSKTLEKTGVISNKAYYKNEKKVASLRKMEHIQFGSSHQYVFLENSCSLISKNVHN